MHRSIFRHRYQSPEGDGDGGGGAGEGEGDGGGAGDGGGEDGGGEGDALPEGWAGVELSDEARALVLDRKWGGVEDALHSYRRAESRLGTPESQLLKLPASRDDAEAMGEVWARLGRPEKPEEYTFDEVQVREGDIDLRPALAPKFHALGLSVDQARGVDQAIRESFTAAVEGIETAQQAAEAQELATLKAQWGSEFDTKMKQAAIAAQALGMDEDTLTEYAARVGIEKAYGTLQTIHTRIGEHRAGAHSGGDGTGYLTAESARAKIDRLKDDPEFSKAFLAGDAQAVKTMNDLHAIAYPGTVRI